MKGFCPGLSRCWPLEDQQRICRRPRFCDTCEREVDRAEATRTETYGDLDASRWQTLCCPARGSRLETVFVADEP
ncbi:hypothetical protein BRC92_04865 [Halobacteriales archaeon QS_4_69_31]|nr:MAG: hypothetical protein BRC92_04865 [Halobacteriales archaeon QS_4_69_31]